MAIYEIKPKCRFCNENLLAILDLGNQPLANATYLKDSSPPESIPLTLNYCEACALPQLGENVDPKILFKKYLWKSGTGKATKDYAKKLPELIENEIGKYTKVLEIACNDGTFLNEFASLGKTVVGIDPAENITEELAEAKYEVYTDFFNTQSAKLISTKHGLFDIVLARNVVPHVNDLTPLIKGAFNALSEKGYFVIEFHSADKITTELQYDSIYHEHIFYFSLTSLTRALNKFGFNLHSCFNSPMSGGSIVAFFDKSKNRAKPSAAAVKQLEAEERQGLHLVNHWRNFASLVRDHSKLLKTLCQSFDHTRMFAFGASARSSTLMNYCGINSDLIEFIIDNNELKQERFTPGTNIPIVSMDYASPFLGDFSVCFLTAWNFKNEIINILTKKGFKGKVIIPFPTPSIIDTNVA